MPWLAGILLLAAGQSGAGAEEALRYRARISAQDQQNSRGTILTEPEQIIRQDRANFHRGLHRDPDDEGDPVFGNPGNREKLEALAKQASLPADLAKAIVSEELVIEVILEKDPVTGRESLKVVRAEMDSGDDSEERDRVTLELLERWRFSPPATPDSIERGDHEDATFPPMARQISWRGDEIEVMPKKGLRFRVGAFTHDGDRVLVEAAPGLVELWDLPTNSLLLSHRLVDGEITQIVRAREEGWMLCVAEDLDFHRLVIRFPVIHGKQPECLWSCSFHPEESYDQPLVLIHDVLPGFEDGELLFSASSFGGDLEFDLEVPSTVVVSWFPEEGEAKLLAPSGTFDTWWEERLAEPGGAEFLGARQYGEGEWGEGIPSPGVFCTLAHWIRDEFPEETYPYLEPLPVESDLAEVFRFLDSKGTRELVTLQPVDPPTFEDDYRVSGVAFPGATREHQGADLRRIGYDSPFVTIQGMSGDGQYLLVKLANSVRDEQGIRYQSDSFYTGYGRTFETYRLLLLNLQTLETTLLFEGENDAFATFTSEGRILQGILREDHPVADLELRTLRGTTIATWELPHNGFDPVSNTVALREVEEGRFEFSFAEFEKCSSRTIDEQNPDLTDPTYRPTTCFWHGGLQGGRYLIGFSLPEEGPVEIECRGCDVVAMGAGGAKANQIVVRDPQMHHWTLQFASNEIAPRILHVNSEHSESPIPHWSPGDGGHHVAAYSPSGQQFFSSSDIGPMEPGYAWLRAYQVEDSQELFSAYTGEDEGDRLAPISGEALVWLGEEGVAFVTESSVVTIKMDGSGLDGIRSAERVQGGAANRAFLDSSRGWLAFSRDNAIDFYEVDVDRDPQHRLSLFFDGAGNLTAVNPRGQFAGYTRDGASCSLVREGKAYPFTQFDLQLNRPDVILETLGAKQSLVEAAAILRSRRLARAGFEEGDLAEVEELPRVELVEDLPLVVESNSLTVSVRAACPTSHLDRLQVYSNGVPVLGQDGKDLSGESSPEWEGQVAVPLLVGENEIEISVRNTKGVESLAETLRVVSEATTDSTLYVVTLGVSEYQDSRYDLNVAAKDARDVATFFENRPETGIWKDAKVLCLTDESVTREALASIRSFLAEAKPQDLALLFAAGHGLLDKDYRYFFATWEMDFENPGTAGGLEFEEIESVLGDCRALRKLGLIDSCHAGELDEDSRLELDELLARNGVRSAGVIAPPPAKEGEGPRVSQRDRQVISGLFADLRRGSGATIIGASGGAEFALEAEELGNGVFTHLALRCVRDKEGDRDGDGRIDVRELRSFVETMASEMTGGMQNPSSRRFNLSNPFVVSE